MDQPDLRSAEHYINRELSLLEFNERVLAQALDDESAAARAAASSCASRRTISTSSSRSASPASSSDSNSARISRGADGLTITEQLQAIHERTRSLVDAQYALPERRAAARPCGTRASNCWRAPTWDADDRAVARAIFRARSRAGAVAARARSGAAIPAHPEQEPEFHRAPARARMPSAATPGSPSCRRRARCRASLHCPKPTGASVSCC